MAIVTISRISASGGMLLAEGLAKTLGFHIVSREEIIVGAAKFGVSREMLDKAMLDPPTFSEDFKQDRRRYLIFIQEALCEQARKDNVIYHGNAGHLLLQGVSHLLRICLIAPLDFRIRTLIERHNMTSDQAAAYIKKVDAQRRAWTLLLYGVDWLNPNLYDLSINIEKIGIAGAVETAAAAARRPEFLATGESQKAIDDLFLATRVKAALAADPVTKSIEVDLQADSASGTIYLRGNPQPEIAEKAGEVPGVARVDRIE